MIVNNYYQKIQSTRMLNMKSPRALQKLWHCSHNVEMNVARAIAQNVVSMFLIASVCCTNQ